MAHVKINALKSIFFRAIYIRLVHLVTLGIVLLMLI